jgi:ABC-type uncharacterized transport system involved in gliding motility auxiliary subunit
MIAGMAWRPAAIGEVVLFGLQILGAAAGCVLLLILAARHNARLDLTPTREHSLDPASQDVLARLDRDVVITIFFDARDIARQRAMRDLLARYAAASPHVRARFRDLDRNPGLARALGVTRYNTGVLEADRRHPLGVVDEAEVTAALLRVVEPQAPAVYFTAGHGERDPLDTDERRGYSELARALEAENYGIGRLDPAAAPVPANAAVLIVAEPRRDFAAAEIAALRAHVESGGGLVLLLDPGAPATIVALAEEYGIRPSADVVVDERGSLLGGDRLLPQIPYVNQEVFARPPELPALLPEAQSVALVDEPARSVEATYLATTAEHAWADVDRDGLEDGPPRFERGVDRPGPIPVAAWARPLRSDGTPTTGGIVVIGDADFASNLYLGVLGNRDLLLATLSLLTRREIRGLARDTQPPRTLSPLHLTPRDGAMVFWTTVVLPPLGVSAAGLLAALRRRRGLRTG